MTRVFQHKTNKKLFRLNNIVDGNAYLNDMQSGDDRVITVGTLHRYYQEIEQIIKSATPKEEPKKAQPQKASKSQKEEKVEQKEQQVKKSYYKTYKRNEIGLWDAVLNDNKLCLRDPNKQTIIYIYKTENCFVVCMAVGTGGKRYFKDIEHVINHVLHDQDIRTVKQLTLAIQKWAK